MQMGASGCVWVRMGAGDTGVQRNNTWRHKNGPAVPDSGPMVGEIFPDIMFLRVCGTWGFMGVGGQLGVSVHALGNRDTGGTKNNRKRNINGRVVLIFVMHVRAKKNRWSAWMVMMH